VLIAKVVAVDTVRMRRVGDDRARKDVLDGRLLQKMQIHVKIAAKFDCLKAS